MYACSKPTRPNFTKFSVHVTCNDRGSDFSEFVYLLFGAGVYGNLRDGGDTEDHGAWPVSLPQGPLELLQGPLKWFKDRWNCFKDRWNGSRTAGTASRAAGMVQGPLELLRSVRRQPQSH